MNRLLILLSVVVLMGTVVESGYAQTTTAPATTAVPAVSQPISLSTSQQDIVAQSQYDIKNSTEVLSRNCGKKIEIKIDWASFAKEDWSKHNPASWCLQPVGKIQFECQTNAAFKNAIASKMQTIACKMGTPGNDLYSMAGGALNYSVDWGASNVEDKVIAFLKSSL